MVDSSIRAIDIPLHRLLKRQEIAALVESFRALLPGADLGLVGADGRLFAGTGAWPQGHSGNLDRIQIIKGWLDASGTPQEKIYDVVWSDADKRKIVNGKLAPVGNTVDVEGATWTNTIGDSELITVWSDPDFDPKARAFYYVRVLEIPTPRWTAYDAAYFKVKMDPKVPRVTQERAITSPIWYVPR